MNHPPTYVRTFSLHKVRENCYFLDHPPNPMTLRNKKMVPKVEKRCIYVPYFQVSLDFTKVYHHCTMDRAGIIRLREYGYEYEKYHKVGMSIFFDQNALCCVH